MKRIIAIAAVVFAMGTAEAEEFDVADITCRDRGTIEETTLLLFWIDGYLSGRTGDTRYSDKFIEGLYDAVAAECARNPNQTILGVVERLK